MPEKSGRDIAPELTMTKNEPPAHPSAAAPSASARGNDAPSAPEEIAIDVNHVQHAFTKDSGVFDLNFQIPRGTIFGLIGPSGCGKTTTVRLLTGILKPDDGEIRVLGETPTRFTQRMRARIGYMPQSFTLYPMLTARENLNFVASLYGVGFIPRRRRISELLDFVELTEARHRLNNQMSGGMQRRLQLAAALINSPDLLFADEPTASIDPILRQRFWDYFRSLRDRGRTLFVTTQYVDEATHCDYVGILRQGRLIALDTPENLRKRALGGEIVRVVVDPQNERQAEERLRTAEIVRDVRRDRSVPGTFYIYTDDAARAMPVLASSLNGDSNITIKLMEPYVPPFDDIFVRLIEEQERHA